MLSFSSTLSNSRISQKSFITGEGNNKTESQSWRGIFFDDDKSEITWHKYVNFSLQGEFDDIKTFLGWMYSKYKMTEMNKIEKWNKILRKWLHYSMRIYPLDSF